VQDGKALKHSAHLVKRFFGYLTAQTLTDTEREHIAGVLPTELATLFFGMQPQDQRHAYDVYVRSGGGRLTQASLLHDVGKSVSRIGPLGRSFATISRAVGIPTKGRWQLYVEHGPIGAELLHEAGADALAVSFTRNHPGPPPSGVDPRDWDTLTEADEA
jgi:hypothetical protein